MQDLNVLYSNTESVSLLECDFENVEGLRYDASMLNMPRFYQLAGFKANEKKSQSRFG